MVPQDNDIQIARLVDRVDTNDRNITELSKQFNAHRDQNATEFDYIKNHVKTDWQNHTLRRANEYTDTQIKLANLQMSIDHQELAKEISQNLKQDAWTIAKVVDYVFRIGMVAGMLWVGVQTAKADDCRDDKVCVAMFSDTPRGKNANN